MPRRSRPIVPGTVYHLISRFVAKEWFIERDEQRWTYLWLLGIALRSTDWRCFSYAIMSNHIHLGVLAGSAPLRPWIHYVHTYFAEYINARRERIGAVFVRGPQRVAYRQDGAARLLAYIHRNPVRAGLVQRAALS